jgi:ABC-type transport system substrate-binding protein
MQLRGLRPIPLLPAVAAATLLFAFVACGGTETVVQTVIVEKEKVVQQTVEVTKVVEKEKTVQQTVVVVQTATATPAPVPTATAPVTPPAGELVLVNGAINVGIGTPRFCTAGCAENVYQTSVMETLFRPNYKDTLGEKPEEPVLATGWTLAPDLTYLDFDLRKGIQFQKGYGEMTASDVAFSINDANSVTTPTSIHGQAGDFAPLIKEMLVVDPYKIRLIYLNYDSRGIRHRFSLFWQTAGVTSKKLFEEKGADGMRGFIIGTGPYQVVSWVQSDKIVLEALPRHWRKTASVAKVTYIQVPETATRRAMLETGQVAAIPPGLKDIKALEAKGFKQLCCSGNVVQSNIGMTGNYWEKERYYDKKALTRTLNEAAPWVGKWEGDDAASDLKARNVRQALAHAIDRDGLVASIMTGLGGPNYFAYMPPTDHPVFKKGKFVYDPATGKATGGWEIPYDPKFAKELLAKAGYGNGFTIPSMWIDVPGTVANELGQAIASGWATDLNVKVTTLNSNIYSTYRPGLVQRTTSEPFIGCGDDSNLGVPFDWARGLVMSSWSDGGYGVGMEVPWAAQNYATVAKETDKAKRVTMQVAFIQRGLESGLCIGTVMIPTIQLYDPKIIASWEQLPSIEGGMAIMNNLESIVLVKR